MSFPLEALASIGGDQDRPAFKGFLERIHDGPTYKRALERGGPYNR